MTITLLQGILLALVGFLLGIDQCTEAFSWFRPLVVSFFAGAVLGNVQVGLQSGAVAELAYLGLLTVGGTVPPDSLMAGMMTTVLAYSNASLTPEAALGLSLPFAMLAQWWGVICNTMFAMFNAPADKCCANADYKGLTKLMALATFIRCFGIALIVFLSAYAIQGPIQTLVNQFPAWLIHGFTVAGNLLPGVGLALLMRVMLRKENIVFLFIGFLMKSYISMGNVLPVAALAACIAVISYSLDKRMESANAAAGNGGNDNGGI